VVIVAVYAVEYARLAEGVNVAVVPVYETAPLTGLFRESFRVKVEAVTVEASMGSVKVAAMEALTAMPVAPSEGFVDETEGGVVSFEPPPSPEPQPAETDKTNAKNTSLFSMSPPLVA
jgi:hypothetical protein